MTQTYVMGISVGSRLQQSELLEENLSSSQMFYYMIADVGLHVLYVPGSYGNVLGYPGICRLNAIR